jgi:hypothetical protein
MRRASLLLSTIALLTASVTHARTRHTISIHVPTIALAPGSNVETCYLARIPASEAFQLGSWKLQQVGAKGGVSTLHFLVYLYMGEHLADYPGGVQLSRGCLDIGPVDRDQRVLVATGGGSKRVVRSFPPGVAMGLDPTPDAPGGAPATVGLLFDTNWNNNAKTVRKVSTHFVLHAAPAKRVHRMAHVMMDRSANAGILVAPFTEGATEDHVDARWTAAADACVLGLTTQMHRRGRCDGIDLLGTDGQPDNPVGSPENRCSPGRKQLFVGADFSDPGSFSFATPLVLLAGQALRYGCWLDNGAQSVPVRLGCETSPGVTPGAVDTPATECTIAGPASPDCPGSAACVPANAVAGPTPDDELCGITALVYDPAPGGSCDVSSAP